MVSVKYFGQSCFLLDDGENKLLFDPYLSKNPAQVAQPDEVHPTFILVSHGHADHVGDAVEISNNNNAPIVTTPEVGHYLEEKGCKATELLHIGGRITLVTASVLRSLSLMSIIASSAMSRKTFWNL